MSPRFYGPFEVLERIGEVAYKLLLPPKAKIHSIFHVSQLKPAIRTNLTPLALPPQLSDEGILVAEPEGYAGERVNSLTGQQEVLIKWKGLLDHDSTWEWRGVIQEQFPSFNLEDNVTLKRRVLLAERWRELP